MKPILKTSGNGTGPCAACAGESYSVLLNHLSHQYTANGQTTEWPYRLIECSECGLGSVDPKPSWEVLQTFYNTSYGNFDGSQRDPVKDAHSIKSQIAKLRASKPSDGIKALCKTGVGILCEWVTGKTIPYTLSVPLNLGLDTYMFDLGYGSGNWLLMMSELGYQNLYGYDIDANSENASRLREKGINVSSGQFLSNPYPEMLFDCIHLDHVFEHIHEPVKVLERCRDLLKPGGFLLMSLPCKNSWSMKLSLPNSPALQLPKHLYHHTQDSVRRLLENSGFEVLKIHAYSVASQLAGTINGTLRERNARPISPVLFEMLGPAYKLFGSLTRKGDFMTVKATNRDPLQ